MSEKIPNTFDMVPESIWSSEYVWHSLARTSEEIYNWRTHVEEDERQRRSRSSSSRDHQLCRAAIAFERGSKIEQSRRKNVDSTLKRGRSRKNPCSRRLMIRLEGDDTAPSNHWSYFLLFETSNVDVEVARK